MQRTARACSEERAARAARLFFHTRPTKFLIYGVVVAAPVVDAKTPYSLKTPQQRRRGDQNVTNLHASLTLNIEK